MDEHIYTRELEADEVICYEDDGKQTTMTLKEVRNLPPLTEEETETALHFANTDFSDYPKSSKNSNRKNRPPDSSPSSTQSKRSKKPSTHTKNR